MSRNRVFELRGRSDAIIVGGNTVRKDSKYLHYMQVCDCFVVQWLQVLKILLYIIILFHIRSKTNCKTWRRAHAHTHHNDKDS